MPCYLKPHDFLPDLNVHLLLFGVEEKSLLSLNLVKRIISSDHPTLRFPRNTKLGVCDKCTLLRTCKLLAHTDFEKKSVQQEMRQHTSQHQNERKAFYCHHEQSSLHPTLQWSTLSDSTSQMSLPYIAPLPKGWSTIKRLGITVFGLINFATKYRVLVPLPPVWKFNCNLTISLVYQHYYNMFSRSNCPRSPVLYETTDGSPKEYKNMINMCFAAFKVCTSMFKEVYLYFLPPGHSHDLQDQAWSNLKQAFYSSRITFGQILCGFLSELLAHLFLRWLLTF